MAEFVEVMRQAERMCNAYKCKDCPIAGLEACSLTVFVGKVPIEKMGELENCIMRWAVEHPEKRYPTWKEWQEANFPAGCKEGGILPCRFVGVEEMERIAGKKCNRCFCRDCENTEIPADIAEKLGIKPIGE